MNGAVMAQPFFHVRKEAVFLPAVRNRSGFFRISVCSVCQGDKSYDIIYGETRKGEEP